MKNLKYYTRARKIRDKRNAASLCRFTVTTGTTAHAAILLFLKGSTPSPDVHPLRDPATFSLKCYVTYGRFDSKDGGFFLLEDWRK